MKDIWDRLLATPKGGEWGASPWTIVGSFFACCLTLAVIDSTGCFLPRKTLKRADRIEWNVRLVSSIHAIVLVIGTVTAATVVSVCWVQMLVLRQATCGLKRAAFRCIPYLGGNSALE